MRIIKAVVALGIVAGGVSAAAAPAYAAETFASFSPVGTSANVQWANSNGAAATGTGGSFVSTATSSSSVAASRLVSFSFLDTRLAPYFTGINAAFTLNASVATGNAASFASGFLVQDSIGGSFSFKSVAPIVIGTTIYAAGANLLTGSFGGTAIAGQRRGTTALFAGSTDAGDTLVYTSDFLSFTNVSDSDFAISLGAVTPALNAAGPTGGTPTAALRTFRSVASGTFSTDPNPLITARGVPAVPEPATWVMMLAGFGLVGGTLRSRVRQTVKVSYA